MVRPKKCRAVAGLPEAVYFKPAGIPMRLLEEVKLTVEEYEAFRLCDRDGLNQAETGQRMGVSRASVQRVLASARKKVAEALAEGKALRIEGGNYHIYDGGFTPGHGQCRRHGQGEDGSK
jgi:predicted DNA-binding protein (UPF0251 family)